MTLRKYTIHEDCKKPSCRLSMTHLRVVIHDGHRLCWGVGGEGLRRGHARLRQRRGVLALKQTRESQMEQAGAERLDER